jgi:predicted nucleic acid-binding protein
MTRSKSGPRPIEEAISLLTRVVAHPGYRYWPIVERATTLIAPFAARIFGHQQITDACLLGLAVKENGVLVTMDKALSYLAGSQYRHNLLVLE